MVAAGVAAAILMPNTTVGKIGPSNVIKEPINKNICNECGHEW